MYTAVYGGVDILLCSIVQLGLGLGFRPIPVVPLSDTPKINLPDMT